MDYFALPIACLFALFLGLTSAHGMDALSLAPLFHFQENDIWTKEKDTPAMKLARDLSRNYNPNVRPVINESKVTDVDHLFILHQLVYLDSKEQRLKALYFEVWEWTDEFLTWDPDVYGGVTEVTISREQIWLPDIVVYNELGDNFNYFMKENLIPVNVNYKGRVKCETPLMLETICILDISDFPYDQQDCEIKVGSWSQPSHKITINSTQYGLDLSDYIENSEWALLYTTSNNLLKYYAGNNYFFSELNYSIRLERRRPFYERNMILPTILTSSMSTMVFFLPPESGEKISMAITVFLALSLNMLAISHHIPNNSLQIPVVSRYSMFSLGSITFSLWLSMVVINIHGYRSQDFPRSQSYPPKYLMKISRFLWPYISITCEGTNEEDKSFERSHRQRDQNVFQNQQNGSFTFLQEREGCDTKTLQVKPSGQKLQSSAKVSRTNNRSSTNGQVLTGPLGEVTENKYQFESKPFDANSQEEASKFSEPQICTCRSGITNRTLDKFDKLLSLLSSIECDSIKESSSHWEEMEKSRKIAEEWKFLASFIDRCLAITYLILTVVATVICFLPYYI